MIRSFTLDDKEEEKKIDGENFKLLKSNPELCKLVQSVLHRSRSNSPVKPKVLTSIYRAPDIV